MLLSAQFCEKGDRRANLAEHRRVLVEARDRGCSLAVFPEMSLTGSVDPARNPEQLVALDDPAVLALAATTGELGVAAVYGIAERSHNGAAHITQLFAQQGDIVGVQRKRFLGEGEEAFAVTDEDTVFELDGTPFAVAICAESRIDRPFAYARSAGLRDTQRHARERGLWIAIATQAGATVDEDFPGLAALVNPAGEVVAQLPDWRPGTLVVDVPFAP